MDRIKKLLLVLLLLGFAAGIAAADQNDAAVENTATDEVKEIEIIDAFATFDHALGCYYYGELEEKGLGLSYQQWFGRIGFQTALGLWYNPEDLSYREMDAYNPSPQVVTNFSYSAGAEMLFMVYQDSFKDWFDGGLYVFLGLLHVGNLETTYNYEQTAVVVDGTNMYPFAGKTGPTYAALLSPSFGIGFEFAFFNHFSVPFEVKLMGSWELGTAMPVDAGIAVQTGLRYRF